MRVAIASCFEMPSEFTDDRVLAARLRERGVEVAIEPWDDPAVEWERFDLVVIRSTWDYTRKLEAFREWAERLDGRLENPAAVVRWNSDKRYLGDLAAAGLPVVETRYVAPGEPLPDPDELPDELVVKPSVSAGGRDTGRFGRARHAEALALVERIVAGGRTAMIQPYLRAVDARGETAIVTIAGRESHVLRKRAVLRPDEVAPVRPGESGVAEAMYDPDLVGAGEASAAERELARAVLAELERRFGRPPLVARVDMVAGPAGEPAVLELEAIEPALYFDADPAAADRLADAIVARLASAPAAVPDPA